MEHGSNHKLRSTALTVFGSAMLWAWGYLCYLGPAMFPYSLTEMSIGIENSFFISQISAALFALVIFFILKKRQIVVPVSYLFVAAVAISCSVLIIEAVINGLLPSALFLVSGLIDGIGVPLLGIAWGTRYCLSAGGKFKAGSLIMFSFLVAYLIYFVVSVLPYPFGVVIVFILPVGSWFAWRVDAGNRHTLVNDVLPSDNPSGVDVFPGEMSAGDRDYYILPWRAISLIAFASLTANFISSFVMGWSYQTVGVVSGGFIVVAGITTMAYMLSVLNEESFTVESVYRFTLPFTIVGLLAMLLFGQNGISVGGALINGCGMFMQSLVIFKVVESTQRQGLSPLLSFSVGQGLIALMVFLGNIAGKLLFNATGFSVMALDILCAAGILVLFFMLLYMTQPALLEGVVRKLPESQPDNRLEVPAESGETAQREMVLAQLVQRHGLTTREAEIFGLLGKGRSLPFIADQLFVTTGTVKTHTMHIYRKLDINSRQELLDLIEAASV